MASELRKRIDRQRRERTRRTLKDAALVVFVRQGYHEALVSDIVAEAGVGQGTFYRNFESKRQIFELLFDDFVASLMAEFADMSTHLPRDAEEYRSASVDAMVAVAQLLRENRDVVLLFLRQGPAIDSDFAQRLGEVQDQFAGLAKLFLDYAIANGFARTCDSDVVSQAIVGVTLRFIGRWLEDRFPFESLRDRITEVVDFAFLGIGPRPAPETSEAGEGRRKT